MNKKNYLKVMGLLILGLILALVCTTALEAQHTKCDEELGALDLKLAILRSEMIPGMRMEPILRDDVEAMQQWITAQKACR